VAVAVQDEAGAQATVESSNVSYPVLADPGHQVADAYGVYNLLNDGVAAPAVFVIDANGRVVWSYIAKDINDRPDNQTIFDNLPG
jgi:peroxiredoxin